MMQRPPILTRSHETSIPGIFTSEHVTLDVPTAGPDGRPVSLEEVREADLAPVLFAALRGERPT